MKTRLTLPRGHDDGVNLPSGARPHSFPARAFTLIEMIGVLAIMAILAAMLVPNLARRISRANGEKEDQTLAILADGLIRYARMYQTIPGQASWVTNVATLTGLSLNDVARVLPNDDASARVYLIHPAFTPANPAGAGFADPLWPQTSSGAASVTNAMILIISAHKSSMTLPVSSGKAASAAVFDAIWNWNFDPATKAPPSGWPAAWTGNGEYLHVQRVNFAPVFQRVTFSNAHYPTVYPSAQFGTAASTTLNGAAAMDAFYLQGTYLRLFKDADAGATLDLSHSVEAAMNFLYESNRWRIP
jgi:prepilin-type N-terminal cleavage/methylation domain-containing protein